MSRFRTEREADGRWLAEDKDHPGVMAYGKTQAEAEVAVRELAERVAEKCQDCGGSPDKPLAIPARCGSPVTCINIFHSPSRHEGHTAPAETAEQRPLPPEFYAPVSAERARESAKRYRNLQFKLGGERPRACIPANPDDDDLVIGRFIEQHVRLEREHQVMREALEKIADPPEDGCGCDEHKRLSGCCAFSSYHCPECIAGAALSQIGKP